MNYIYKSFSAESKRKIQLKKAIFLMPGKKLNSKESDLNKFSFKKIKVEN